MEASSELTIHQSTCSTFVLSRFTRMTVKAASTVVTLDNISHIAVSLSRLIFKAPDLFDRFGILPART